MTDGVHVKGPVERVRLCVWYVRHELFAGAFTATLTFVNQSAEDEGLPVRTAAGRPIEDTDVVLWYTFGIHHVPRVEDWPIMPVDIVSFWLEPTGFLDHNPALDV